ncbi:unnamed protein product [Bemisia tabaci]|uniref:Ran GTPase-activating protein n=1 Tax=Bemisia tabaci TaxID=7038 RepID=A0A9P0F969_BEMTA|nr:unnamed protein product [Bemisia tabaci]
MSSSENESSLSGTTSNSANRSSLSGTMSSSENESSLSGTTSSSEEESSLSETEDQIPIEQYLHSIIIARCKYRPPHVAHTSNPLFEEDFASLLQSLKNYIEETQASALNLEQGGFGVEELKSIINLLINSKARVTELDLGFNNFTGGMYEVFDLLTKTEVKKLNLGNSELPIKDFLDMMKLFFVNISRLPIDEFLYLTELSVDTKITDFKSKLISAKLTANQVERLTAGVIASAGTKIDLRACTFEPTSGALLVEALPYTFVTCLCLAACSLSPDILRSLFSSIHQTLITNLDVCGNSVNDCVLEDLCCNLRASKLLNLNLKFNCITDKGMNALAEGLVNSSVMVLDVANNSFFGFNDFGKYLKDTNIQDLDLSCNDIFHGQMFSPPDFLKETSIEKLCLDACKLNDFIGQKLIQSIRYSSVKYLSLAHNDLGAVSFSTLSSVLGDSKLTELFLDENCTLSDSEVISFAESLKSSKVSHISFGGDQRLQLPSAVPLFLSHSNGSSITSIDLGGSVITEEILSIVADILHQTSVKKLQLPINEIGRGVIKLAHNLQFSSITHLDLSNNRIDDLGAEALAICLKDTKIIDLNLSLNLITNQGARAFVETLQNSNLLVLGLAYNKIEDDGLIALAECIQNTFITDLSVRGNAGNRILLIEKVLFDNRVALHHFVTLFNQIAPKAGEIFNLDCPEDSAVSTFVENLLIFYKTLLDQPRSVIILSEKATISLSVTEIRHLMFEVFPLQFSVFLANRLGDNTLEHLRVLRKAEELGLDNIVESLLWNRPVYIINEEHGILHPFVYKLLNKYKQPLYNLAIEPEARTKILTYFSYHNDLSDAQDVIKLLHDKEIKSSQNSCQPEAYKFSFAFENEC